jgi:hypothetical protein
MSNAVVSIYRLDNESILSDFKKRNVKNASRLTSAEIVKAIMSPDRHELELPYSDQFQSIATTFDHEALTRKSKEHGLGIKAVDLNPEILLFKGRIETRDKWAPFFKRFSRNSGEVRNESNIQNSFLLFVLLKEEIFVISSGLSYHQISRYLDEYFGVTILSHLIDADTTEIRSLEDNALYGNVLNSERYFASNYKIQNEDAFGKVYKKILATVNLSELKRELPFLLSANEKRGRNCLGKTHFTVYKAVAAIDAILLTCKLNSIFQRGMNQKLKLSSIRQLKPAKPNDKAQIFSLKRKVHEDFARGIAEGASVEQYSVFYKNMEFLFSAHKYSVFSEPGSAPAIETDNLNDLSMQNIVSKLTADADLVFALKEALRSSEEKKHESLEKVLAGVCVYIENANYSLPLDAPLLSLIQGEVQDAGKTFYTFNGKWFSFDSSLSSYIDSELSGLLGSVQDLAVASLKWDKEDTEDTYIEKYLSSRDYFPIHRIKPAPHKVELADLIRVTDSGIHLIHIKNKFNCSVRELSSQMVIAATLLNNDIKNENCAWLKALYVAVKGSRFSAPYFTGLKAKFLGKWPTERAFVDEIKNSNVTFCIAFTGDEKNTRIRQSPDKYNSIIAKMALIATERNYGQIRDRAWAFKVCQIIRSK